MSPEDSNDDLKNIWFFESFKTKEYCKNVQ